MAEEMSPGGGGEGEGVLLYYKYATVPDVQALVNTYESNCGSLGLLGRIRIAHDGVSVTIGGRISALEKHIEVMRENSLFEGTDFKLAPCDGPSDENIARECGFTALSIRVVKELVTFRPHPMVKSPTISNAGKHLSAVEFHSVLDNAGNKLDSNGSLQHKNILLLDARNLYETRIGMFQTPDVETMNPETRQYSDLPTWINENSQCLQGKHVLMYCTGGIRCEMASAYIRSKGAGYENVYQLFGGIQRYLEQFPDGGFFKGRNFVFDHRLSVGSRNTDIVGSCLLCGSSFDDYSPRCRCTYCRMLVLVCDGCQMQENAVYVCELCQKHGKKDGVASLLADGQFISGSSSDLTVDAELGSVPTSICITPLHEVHGRNGNRDSGKLRILCLHGFRQNASSFKGRTASLAKKLRSMAEFVFVDGLHELPFIYQPRPDNPAHDSTRCSLQHQSPQENYKKRFAWLISSISDHNKVPQDWKILEQPFDPNQYQQQTNGFEESYAYLKNISSQMGPFDGILGFSQGAAMVAMVCQQQQRRGGIPDFRFAILCSGFSLLTSELNVGSINIPSLHIFGSSRGNDRQIACKASKELASLFDAGCSVIIEHEMGHIIPACPPYIDQMKTFLQRFILTS